jgi:hypothetical protein
VVSFAPFVLTPGNPPSPLQYIWNGRMIGLQSQSGQLSEETSLLLCLGNKPRFLSLPFLSLSLYIDWKYKCVDQIYIYLRNKQKNANRRYIFLFILLKFTNMFQLLLRPSPTYHNRIKTIYKQLQKKSN